MTPAYDRPAGTAARSHHAPPVRVVFIGGYGRSGSTLLSRMLGEVPSFCAIGELRYLWRQGVGRNRLCGCGVKFHDCPFWYQVGQEAFGGWDRVDAAEVIGLQRSIERNRYAPMLLAPTLSPRFARRLRRYTGILGALYRGVTAASGCEVVVDSSKSPSSALVLRQVPEVDPYLVHLVRNSNGVAYSWSRTVVRADRGGRLMARHSYARSALEWSGFNLAFDLFPKLGVPSMLLRYEDAVADPDQHVRRVAAMVGVSVADSPLQLGDGTIRLPAGHTVAGNPMRLETSDVRLTVDERWRTELSPGTRRVVEPLTAYGMSRYGYRGRAHSST